MNPLKMETIYISYKSLNQIIKSSLLVFHFLSHGLDEFPLEVFVGFCECQVRTSLACERDEIFGTFFSLMKFNGNLGRGEHNRFYLLLYWLFFCLFILILSNFLGLGSLLLIKIADKLEFP